MRLSGGGYLPPITPESGYRHGLTPDCLAKVMANGQQPTDSIRAGWSESPTGLQMPLEQRAPALGVEAGSSGSSYPPRVRRGNLGYHQPHQRKATLRTRD